MYMCIGYLYLCLSVQSVELDPSSLWEDEDSHQFYVGVTDIRPFVPAILFEGKKKGTSESSDTPATSSSESGAADESGAKEEDAKQEEEGMVVGVLKRFVLKMCPAIVH